jgi:diguanylate cyclase (GGDEF)-like protein/putative nucleotidyltransferase with HDIG domain
MDAYLSQGERPVGETALERTAMARTLACFYLAGAGLGAVSLLLPHVPSANVVGLLCVAAGASLAALVLLLAPSRITAWVVPAFLGIGTLLITAAIYFDGRGESAYALFYVWIVVDAFYFLPRWQGLVQVALAGGCYGGVLTVLPVSVPVQRWLLVIGTAMVAGLLLAHVRGRLQSLVRSVTTAARMDELTGLLNRRSFQEHFDLEVERSRRTERPLSVLVGDLDGFKQVNDRLGNEAGDAALETLARDFCKWKRRIDMAARIGGQEFALLLPESDERGAFLVAERLRRAVHRSFADGPVPVTISFGIATFPEHGDDSQLLLRAADRALYAAKHLGKDRSVIYSSEVVEMLGPKGAGVEMQLATVVNLAEAIDIRDSGTAGHSQAVGRYAGLMAEELGLPEERVERMRLAGILHDVGKIGISDIVLNKPGPLDDDEWQEMRTHPEIAARLLSRPEFDDLRSWIVAHHERLDGTGYPRGLKEEGIPLEARILAVADAYEAMTADRVYRPAIGEHAARAELVGGSGTQFDAAVVQAFLRALDREPAGLAAA